MTNPEPKDDQARRIEYLEELLFGTNPLRRDMTVEEILRAEVFRLRLEVVRLQKGQCKCD